MGFELGVFIRLLSSATYRLDLGANARAEHSESLEISHEERAGDENPLGSQPISADRNRRQVHKDQCAGYRRSIQDYKVASRQPTSCLTFGNTRPEAETGGEVAERRATRYLIRADDQRPQHRRNTASGYEPQALHAAMDTWIDSFKPTTDSFDHLEDLWLPGLRRFRWRIGIYASLP